MSDVQIRRATPADTADLTAVYQSAYAENRELGFPASAESVSAATVTDWIREDCVLVAVDGGEVVGGVRLQATGDREAKVSRLGVRDDRKGEGIGGRLLAAAEDRARDAGHGRVWLTTPPDHPYLPDVYRRRGYEERAPYPLDGRDYDEVVMAKQLD